MSTLSPRGRIAAADWLSLAAAPTFAVMAAVTALGGAGPLDTLCSGASPLGGMFLTGMVPMYVLMSAFHAAPWLKLLSHALPSSPPRRRLLTSRHGLPTAGRGLRPSGICQCLLGIFR
jgi:hypothetical protein